MTKNQQQESLAHQNIDSHSRVRQHGLLQFLNTASQPSISLSINQSPSTVILRIDSYQSGHRKIYTRCVIRFKQLLNGFKQALVCRRQSKGNVINLIKFKLNLIENRAQKK